MRSRKEEHPLSLWLPRRAWWHGARSCYGTGSRPWLLLLPLQSRSSLHAMPNQAHRALLYACRLTIISAALRGEHGQEGAPGRSRVPRMPRAQTLLLSPLVLPDQRTCACKSDVQRRLQGCTRHICVRALRRAGRHAASRSSVWAGQWSRAAPAGQARGCGTCWGWCVPRRAAQAGRPAQALPIQEASTAGIIIRRRTRSAPQLHSN
jgi:hypothetical protein